MLDRISEVGSSPWCPRLPLALAWLWLLVMFGLERLTPLGFAHGVLYLPAVVLALWTCRPLWVWVTALLAMGLTLGGVPMSPSPPAGVTMTIVWGNRCLALVMLLLMAALGHGLLSSVTSWRERREAAIRRSRLIEDEARQALTRSLAEWSALAESMPLTVWTARSDGEIDFISGALYEYTGMSAGELVGQGWAQCVFPSDRAAVVTRWRASATGKQPYEAEFRLRGADGAYRWFLVSARFVEGAGGRGRWYGSTLDIHDRRQLEQAARLSAERLTATMESVTDGVLLLDVDWRITYANPSAAALAREDRRHLLQQELWQVFPGFVGTAFEEEYRCTMLDGLPRRVEAWLEPSQHRCEANVYRFEQGLAIYFRDVTAQRALVEQMQRGQRLEALGQLTGGVAHDFNNLLTVILGNADLLREQLPDSAHHRQLASMIVQAAQRGSELTQRLLAFARKQPLAPVRVDLNRLLGETDTLLRRALGEAVEIELVRAAGLWPTLADPGQLENAMLNLAINARDAMPEGGRLTIETANTWLDEAYVTRHEDLKAGQYVMLAVSDNGTGIEPDVLSRVFEPFFSTKAKGKGTGLGLAMVYGFVKQSGGHVAIYSELSRGTTVKLYFPRLHPSDLLPRPMADVEDAVLEAGCGQAILLVEDDRMVRSYARTQLRSLGYQVLEAADATEALAILRGEQPVDLLFTDVVMPGGMGGRQLVESALSLRPGLAVLYTSGYADNAIVHHGRLDPDVLLLSKPYRRAELARKVRQALG